jgi:hypothetical protein
MEPGGEYVLAGQGWIVRGLLQKLLAGHGGHWVLEISPVLSEYVPSWHMNTVPIPQKYPAGQGTHDPPSLEGTVVKAQALQATAPFQAIA